MRNVIITIACSFLLLASCKSTKPVASVAPGTSFGILSGSELKDIESGLKANIREATGLDLTFTYSGTLDAIDRIAAGEQFDALWVLHGKYLAMNDAMKGRVLAQEKTMLSPVLLGLKTSKAHELGWDAQEPTWKEIADAAKAGRIHVRHDQSGQ